SHGTIAVLVEVALRLFPEPEHEVVVSRELERNDSAEAAARALALPARTVSLTLVASPGERRERLHARLFGRREPVEDEKARFLAAWPGASAVEGTYASAEAEKLRDEPAEAANATLRATCLPPSFSRVREKLERVLADARATWTLVAQPGVAE